MKYRTVMTSDCEVQVDLKALDILVMVLDK